MLGRFLRLDLPKFSSAPSDNEYVFLLACEDRHYNLGFVETRGMD